MITIADTLELPLASATKTFAILAQRRKGKTYTGNVVAEEFVAADVPFVALDPTGAWWGLRASAAGVAPGLPVIVIGGAHGDVPLERTAGKLIADLVADRPGWYVIDLSLFESKEADRQFATEFAERLYRRKAAAEVKTPLHVFIDEADLFVPQQSPSGDKRMVGAFETLVRRGGLHGIGTTLISQRAAVVNKNVLEMLDALIVLRTVGPNDRDAVDAYVRGHASPEQRQVVIGSLASLEVGEAWYYEPGEDLLQRVRVRARRTFNSSATPQAGEATVEPRALAPVDLAELQKRMAETIEREQTNDPKALRRRIADLERALAEKSAATVERVEVSILREEDARAMRGLAESLNLHDSLLTELRRQFEDMRVHVAAVVGERPPAPTVERQTASKPATLPGKERNAPIPRAATQPGDVSLSKSERAVLSVLAQYVTRTRNQVGLLTGYAVNGGGFNNALSALRSKGLIEGSREALSITPAGQALAVFEDLPTGPALLDFWIGRQSKAEGLILRALAAVWPAAMDKAELGRATGYEPSGGGFNNALSRLRTLELITRGTEIALAHDLGEAIQ